ncbi:MAG: putative Ig domain-containing protein [Cytophagaceae bacterium]
MHKFLRSASSGIVLMVLCLHSLNIKAQDSCTFVQQNNLVAIEMESANTAGTYWQKSTEFTGYEGNGYLIYVASDLTGVPGKSVLTFKFRITEPGKYGFKMRGYRQNYHANDVWVRFPHGLVTTERDGVHTGEKGSDWFKVMIGPSHQWFYFASTQNLETHGEMQHQIFVHFDEPGVYTVEFSGRATGFAIDRFTIHKTRTPDGMNPMVAESPKEDCHPYQSKANFPYVVNPIPDQSVNGNSTYSFTIPANTFEHPQGKTLHYAVYQRGMHVLPDWLTFNPSTKTLTGNPTYNHGGDYFILVKAQNGEEFTFDEYKLTVVGNRPPQVAYQVPDVVALIGEEFTWETPGDLFTDADGHELTYSVSSQHGAALPEWLSYNEATKTFSGVPSEGHIGFDTIHITVNDGFGGMATATFQIAVKSPEIQSVKKFAALDMNVYPNPAADRIIISTKSHIDATVDLLDFTGKVLYSANERLSDNLEINLDELNINPGMYYLNVRSSDKRAYSGLIIKR